MGIPWRRVAWLAIRRGAPGIVLAVFACGGDSSSDCEPAYSLAPASVFRGHDGPSLFPVFDVVAADMDLDGDPDLFVNRHHRLRPELYENIDGSFELVNPRGADRSGIFDNPAIPDLFEDFETMQARIRRRGTPGLYVWHDPDPRDGFWRFRLEGAAAPGVELLLRSNTPIVALSGLDEAHRADADTLLLHIPLRELSNQSFGLLTRLVGSQLVLELVAPPGSELPQIRAGATLAAVASPLELWKGDPHGVAWVQIEGTPEPDLFITRGGLRGTLRPPLAPKTDRLHVWQGAPDALYRPVDNGVIPPGYGRGRQVEWVDVDADGMLELYVGNEEGANTLLAREPDGRYQDRAESYALDLHCGESFAWLDLDGNGTQDLLFFCEDEIRVARREAGASGFVVSAGRDIGLALPPGRPTTLKPRERRTLQLLDFDSDGSLDLLAGGVGRDRQLRLFRRVGEHFVDVSVEAGLSALRAGELTLILDAEGDGFVDLIHVGSELQLLRNRGGRRFEPQRLDADWGIGPIAAATVLDANVDGRPDLVLVGRERHLALNVSSGGCGFLRVELGPTPSETIGALVVADHRDGSAQAQRYGSAANTGFSQSLFALDFGSGRPASIRALSVVWPGRLEAVRHPLEPGVRSLRLTAPAPAPTPRASAPG